MNKNEFKALISSWGRLSDATLKLVIASIPNGEMKPDTTGHALLSVFGTTLGMHKSAAFVLGAMSLESLNPAEDPLLPVEVMAFSGLLGSTMGWNTIDGYLNFGETLGRAMERTRISSSLTLKSAKIEIHGETPLGIITAEERDTGKEFDFRFTRRGIPVRREGMLRTCGVDILTLRGIGYMLDAGDVLRRAQEAERQPRD